MKFRLALLLMVSAAGCSPTFNWREVRQEGAPVQMLLPCKPDMGQRELQLVQGQSHMVQMIGCKTGGFTFTVAWADVRHGSLTNAALSAWQTATVDQLNNRNRVDRSVKISGLSVYSPSTLVSVSGVTESGARVVMEGVWFTKDTYVIQAMIVGEASADQVSEPFFSGLSLQ